MNRNPLVIGVDYGTDSVRSIIVDALTGAELASSIFYYPLWKQNKFCDASENQFRQHPRDYLIGLEETIKDCLTQIEHDQILQVKSISIDTTGSTPVAVDRSGTPLALLPEFDENPNAMFIIWKDHTAIQEAAEINHHAKKFEVNYLKYVGGIYSSEWFWAKLLHILRTDEKVRNACFSWVEHCDWIPFLLTGGDDALRIKRGVCSAGHKGLFADEFAGYPPNDFFKTLDPLLNGFTSKLGNQTFPSDQSAGNLCSFWANKLGLSTDVKIGIGAFDAHMGAVGGQIEPYFLSKVMGTSTCDMLVAPVDEVGNTLVNGICGQVNGSIIPGMIGFEAGQSAFGDTYAWFKNLLSWPLKEILPVSELIEKDILEKLLIEIEDKIIIELSKAANQIILSEHSEFAIDWLNGRRTPDANQLLKGAIFGLNLGSNAAEIFRALAESTCFGAKAIVERFVAQGIPVKGIIGLGGVAKKSPFIMQMLADVLNMPIKIHKSEQTCALGAAMFAATVAGIYPKVEDAMASMGQGFDTTYYPDQAKSQIYAARYKKYLSIGQFIELN
ncbi:ribulokinase [Pelobium sp.]|nr:ribulokinase [Pelobium sp.]MDA9554619.1 ribulokinase [Pelobium sp.]